MTTSPELAGVALDVLAAVPFPLALVVTAESRVNGADVPSASMPAQAKPTYGVEAESVIEIAADPARHVRCTSMPAKWRRWPRYRTRAGL